ncbi:EAP30/Vps36 family-domain-containing protein [Lipomyces tetrasporus]|uniref:Vacuolar protein-sorting-associated protein 36 n=1 Tax=Lipomyces tetrasporus TaxID=54092 RepID=A0AAD7QWY3_9ASCO|nr:EAP30/Vps36 family-domain-containing protein [Lipomyces tetrasporus]KAJ8103010.1 EAP30/Vps36 family-domain-containing protein [Lipomyces tetrasporus]
MYFWRQIDLTSARRPVLLPNEVDILVQDGVGLYDGRLKLEGYQDGRVYLTTHRVCYVDNVRPATHSVAIELSQVNRIQFYPGLLRSSPKVSLYLLPQSSPSTPPALSSTSPISPLVAALQAQSLDLGASPTISRSHSPDPNASFSWICPICSFSNSMKYADIDGTLPPCLTCGIRPAISVIEQAKEARAEASKVAHVYAVPLPAGVEDEVGFSCPRCTFVNHPSLLQCEMCGATLISKNLPPVLLDNAMNDLVIDERYPPSPTPPGVRYNDDDVDHIKISFRAGGEKMFLDKLKIVLQDRIWERKTRRKGTAGATQDKHSRTSAQSLPKLGIHGLETQSVRERQRNVELMHSLTDLESLMRKAKEMVSLAESFAMRLSNAPGVPAEARTALLQSSEALSLSSPIVMREMAGSGDETFYAELARQLAEFLDSGVLVREGGILTLFDLYALYNRARGLSLISPKDFYKACSIFEKLRLPFRLRKFRRGVIVVQEAYYSDDAVNSMLMDWITKTSRERGISLGVTAQDVNQRFGWSVTIALEELETAEVSGKLARDSSVEGTRFYENLISTFQWTWKLEVFHER